MINSFRLSGGLSKRSKAMEKTRVALVRQGEQTVFEAVKEAVDRIGGIGTT